MPVSKVIAASDAAAVVHSGDVIASSGYGGHGIPEQLLVALEDRYLSEGAPSGLTLVHAAGQGDGGTERGLNRLASAGMLRRVVGGYYGLAPRLAQLAVDGEIEAYNFPEGVILHLYRQVAAGSPGLLSTIGLGTFVDPRVEGGKLNAATTEDLVQLVEFGGEDWLFYRAFPIDIALVRGTTADPFGNVTMEHEALALETLLLAIAARTSGGYVICQVERIAEPGSLDSRDVRLPGILVDAVVVAEPEHHMQTYGTRYNAALSGELRVPVRSLGRIDLNQRSVIARRAALEMKADEVVNLGLGLPELVGRVAAEENIEDLITLTVDPGVIGGVPLGGLDFGAAVNPDALIDHASAFDFIDGGGLDRVFLGIAQCSGTGDVNVSRFGDRLAGCGGFINLTQRTPHIVFMTTFTSGGLVTRVEDGALHILNEGKVRKFVDQVEQITFSAARAVEIGQQVIYVTERCVFSLGPDGLLLTEVAPGIDVESQILALLPFTPSIDGPTLMELALFDEGLVGMRERMLDIGVRKRLSYDEKANTVYMDFAGMHIRTRDDVEAVVAAVDALLGPLGRKVNSVVNYDRFVLDDEATSAWADAVQYVADTYYLKVSRHTTSGFLRLKLGKELRERRLEPSLYDSAEEAHRQLDS